MNKNILRKFAIESRKDLMHKIENKIKTFYTDENFSIEQKGDICVLYSSKHSLSLTYEEYQKRELLIKRINELSLEQVVEEAAYTWFNRIIAIRYMELNDMLPLTKDNQSLGIRVLSSKDNTPDPEILKFANLMNPELDINFKKEKYVELKDDNEKFKYVLLLVCKKLGRVIPQVFDGVTDYIDILIPDNLLNDTGFIAKLINEVPENNYNQVEIIGWLYQFYISEKKDEVFTNLKKNIKVNAETLPAATQLFTPDWIVKYLVENTLGTYGNINDLKYRIESSVESNKGDIRNITFIDPCCGSGHILVYAFELFYIIYENEGFNKSDIPEYILSNNLYGIDIDKRAVQLSILSVLLKAREYDKHIFSKKIVKNLNIIEINDSVGLNDNYFENFTENIKNKINYLMETYKNAKELGSLIKAKKVDFTDVNNYFEKNIDILTLSIKNICNPLIMQNDILTKKYDIVITNPPYMGNNSMSSILVNYLKKNYDEEKMDLYTVFIKVCQQLCKEKGYFAMITQQGWMFLPTYLKMRNEILNNVSVCSLLHLGPGTFDSIGGEVVQSTAFVIKNEKINDFETIFVKLDESNNKEKDFLNTPQIYKKKIDDLKNIKGFPLSYWLPNDIIKLYRNSKTIEDVAETKQGLKSSNDSLFFRLWFEVNYNKICREYYAKDKRNNYKWFPLSKGGKSRWYGDTDNVINWENNGKEIKEYAISKYNSVTRTITSIDYYFRKCIAWNQISTTKPNFKSFDDGFIFCSASPSLFCRDNDYHYILALLNCRVSETIIRALNPTINFGVGDILKTIYIYNEKYNERIKNLAERNIELSRYNWNTFETSWDFKNDSLVKYKINSIKKAYSMYKRENEEKYRELKNNEEEINKLFIEIYGLNGEIKPEVKDDELTYKILNEKDTIKNLISYAVGCMFGRYSLDKDGLIYAGGDFDKVYKKYKGENGGWAGVSLANYTVLNDNGKEIDLSFVVDNDNVIPITDEAYFGDDIVERFKKFISVVFGKETLNENLDFIAETLGKKGTETSEDTIRRYFVNDFFNDHVKIYQKRPIYWLFDSGKKNGFKALIYMHRYNESLVPKIRLDYLHRMQTTYEKLLSDINYKLTTELSMTDKKEAQKRQADLNAKLQEIKEYDEKIAHIANQRISIDLDDGVKVNYEKFKDILAKIK